MKVRNQGMLATAAAAAAIIASGGMALADGMPGGPGYYAGPGGWSGVYFGLESGWDHENVDLHSVAFNTNAHWDRDGVTYGLFGGYQHQFGPLVVGVELSLIGNQFDNQSRDVSSVTGAGNCPNPAFNCTGRITDVFTIGPRLGWSLGRFMPYATGGWATGSINERVIPIGTSGVASEMGDARADGWYAGGGLDWKLSPHAVVGIEYRHVDLGSTTMNTIVPATGAPADVLRVRADSDSVMVRGSLLFGVRDYAPLK